VACLFEAIVWMADLVPTRRTAFLFTELFTITFHDYSSPA
jgi:hypothetical protein